MQFTMTPIGVIHSPFKERAGTPVQPSRSQAVAEVEVYPEYSDGLQDIEDFSHVTLLFVLHCSSEYTLRVKPFLDDRLHGVFATRYPCRPNRIGLSIVRLLARRGSVLEIQGADMIDGSPLLDIKPYVPDFDIRTEADVEVRTGWYAHCR